jgi:hypothetical protein
MASKKQLAPEGREPHLAAKCGPDFRIGFVDDIHGEGGTEVPGFIPTVEELRQLARHWEETALDIEVFWFYYNSPSSKESRMRPYARMRVKRIASLIGWDAVDKVIDEVEDRERERMGPEDWRIFTKGTEAEQAAVSEKALAEIEASIEKKTRGRAEVVDPMEVVPGDTEDSAQ